MIPAAFDYEVAESVDHAIELLGSDGDTSLLAGGHSLIPAMRLRIARPTRLVDIGRLSDLSYVRDGGDHLAIGALTRHKDVASSDVLQASCPIVSHTAGLIGDPAVRHRGTIGGSLAHGDPASDMPAVMMALGARIMVQGPDGERDIGAANFFTGVFTCALRPAEIVTEIRVPHIGPSTGWSYQKYHRRAQDWATVGVAALVMRDNGNVVGSSITLTNMGPTPVPATAAEVALTGSGAAGEAAAHAADGTDPPSDQAASAEFRRHLARVLTRRALDEALAR